MIKRNSRQITLKNAIEIIHNIPPVIGSRRLPILDSVGHILAESLYAAYPIPEVPISTTNGFAVVSSETTSAGDQNPVTLTHFERITTGKVVGNAFDAVIKTEDARMEMDKPDKITIRKNITTGTDIRKPGDEIEKDQLILPAGIKIHPFHIGAMAAYGFTSVKVKRICIGIIQTGSEMVMPGTRPAPGQIVESNTIMAEAYLRQFGTDVIRYPHVMDNRVLIHGALEKALNGCDVVLISTGSSAEAKVFTASIISEIGNILFHEISMKPGKTTMLGIVKNTPVFVLPGDPLGVQTVLQVLVAELLKSWGWTGPEKKIIPVVLGSPASSDKDIDEFGFYAAAHLGNHYSAIPLNEEKSRQMTSVRSNLIIQIPLGTEGFDAGDIVNGFVMVPVKDIEQTILIAGVYDPSIDRLTEKCLKEGIHIRVGPTSEISALTLLKNEACHFASISNEKEFQIAEAYNTVKLGKLNLVAKKEITDKKVRRVLELASEI